MSTESSPPAAFAKLHEYDTPTVLNVIELLDVVPRDEGFADGTLRAVYPEMSPIVGFATTATFRSSRPESGDGGSYSGFVQQVEEFVASVPAPRIVVFEDLDDPIVAATFGEVMCSVYKAFGCVGLITSGAARDVDQVRAIGFPCWSTSVIASHGYCRILDHGEPVEVAGLEVAPGDVLHADANGVARVPADRLDDVARGCELLVEAEDIVLDYVRSGAPTTAGLREARERSQERIAAIGAELRGGRG